MKRKLTIVLVACVLACGVMGGCTPSDADKGDGAGQAESAGQANAAAPEKKVEAKEVVTDECISCHSLDEVSAASADYVAESGEVANPHRTVDEDAPNPHEATGYEKVIDCGKCHTAHESDTPSADDVKLPENVNYCYTKCHHQRTFEDCSDCHNDK